MKNTRSAAFCADQIDVIRNVAVITNVVIKRVHCTTHRVDIARSKNHKRRGASSVIRKS